mgnify:CR=1 FL=1
MDFRQLHSGGGGVILYYYDPTEDDALMDIGPQVARQVQIGLLRDSWSGDLHETSGGQNPMLSGVDFSFGYSFSYCLG